MHVVAAALPDRVEVFDLVLALQVFAVARRADGTKLYEIRVCGDGETTAMARGQLGFGLRPSWPSSALDEADTVLIASGQPPYDTEQWVLDRVRRAAQRGARIASLCTGAFALAATGLLAGQRATTHWLACTELADRYPEIDVDPTVLFVDNGSVLTSAGSAAVMDMCLHMVRNDYGAEIAADAARYLVMPLQRDGGQAQFIPRTPPPTDRSALQPVLEWIEQNLERPLAQIEIARAAGMSVRSLQRHFHDQLGTTAQHWLLHARLDRARQLLETTELPIDQVAEAAGFGTSMTLRRHFTREVGTAPRAYRNAFR
ncbi:GlxA family transcriptional regulator [Nocardia suismassiliense]|uniref:GlxA family transcriptional regulator n=1 Tax=Nocardia suismassiliense TaxID=2077092 RepID=UPI000D1F7812|nr:helix-turn-helix domain-containing protein [Nocardia suismassiliense]